MNFLAYLYELPNATSGLDTIITQTITQVPLLAPFLLAFVFFIVFMGGMTLQLNRNGIADYPMWSVVASLSTFIIALILSVTDGYIRLDTLIIVTVITIFSGVWLYFDRKTSEI